ncbi:MAG: hypothetical protein JSW50_11350 [Candidatus Latescibacterota bacterium]|nr:MAG: hypothetical protein JSW50_11350 [Candidatus Latescibacterota bacterium]
MSSGKDEHKIRAVGTKTKIGGLMFGRMVLMSLLIGGIVLSGCGRRGGDELRTRPARPDNKLKIKAELLSVDPTTVSRSASGRIVIRILLTNLEDKPKVLEFETSKVYSLYAYDTDGHKLELTKRGDPILTTLELEPSGTKIFEHAWDGHVWADGDVIYLNPGRYELEARIKEALSNTEFVWINE